MRRALSLSAVLLLLWVGLALAATNVYYSVCPFGTGNLLSGGSPTIVVDSSGNATLTLGGAAFADNIGQGVCVEYNSVVSFIDSITDSTHFHLVTALGVSASEQTSVAVTSIHHVFASLANAEAASDGTGFLNSSDLTLTSGIDVTLNLACYYDHAANSVENTGVSFEATWITDSTHYIRVFTPQGGLQSVYNQRHTGVWSNNYYRFTPSTLGSTPLYLWNNSIRIEGLQVACSNATGASYGLVRCRNQTSTAVVIIEDCIFDGESKTATTAGISVLNPANGSVHIIKNCIIMNVVNGYGIDVENLSPNVSIYNTVVTNCATGVYRTYGSVTLVNCAVFNNTDDFDGTMTVTYTASDDNDISGTGNIDISPGATEADDWAAAFTDYTNGDFSLKSGSPLIDAGTDLSAVMDSVDIIGTTRPQGTAWDIGAFEYVEGPKWNTITPAKWNGIDWSNLKWNGM